MPASSCILPLQQACPKRQARLLARSALLQGGAPRTPAELTRVVAGVTQCSVQCSFLVQTSPSSTLAESGGTPAGKAVWCKGEHDTRLPLRPRTSLVWHYVDCDGHSSCKPLPPAGLAQAAGTPAGLGGFVAGTAQRTRWPGRPTASLEQHCVMCGGPSCYTTASAGRHASNVKHACWAGGFVAGRRSTHASCTGQWPR